VRNVRVSAREEVRERGTESEGEQRGGVSEAAEGGVDEVTYSGDDTAVHCIEYLKQKKKYIYIHAYMYPHLFERERGRESSTCY